MATGLMAGPDKPPVLFAINGLRLGKWICIPVNVLIMVIPSAPADSIALAMSTILVTLGDNFTYTGTLLAFFTLSVTFAAISGSIPNWIPPSFTFGQEIFNSIAFKSSALFNTVATFSYSSTVLPETFAIIGILN